MPTWKSLLQNKTMKKQTCFQNLQKNKTLQRNMRIRKWLLHWNAVVCVPDHLRRRKPPAVLFRLPELTPTIAAASRPVARRRPWTPANTRAGVTPELIGKFPPTNRPWTRHNFLLRWNLRYPRRGFGSPSLSPADSIPVSIVRTIPWCIGVTSIPIPIPVLSSLSDPSFTCNFIFSCFRHGGGGGGGGVAVAVTLTYTACFWNDRNFFRRFLLQWFFHDGVFCNFHILHLGHCFLCQIWNLLGFGNWCFCFK